MTLHTITPAVGAVCRCKAKTGLRRSPSSLHTRTRLSLMLRLNLDSSLKTTWFHSAAVQFPRARHHSKRRRRWVDVKGSTRNGRRDPKYPSARQLCMVQVDIGAPSEGATYAWMAADEAVGCTCAFLMMWRSSCRLVCRGRSEPSLQGCGSRVVKVSDHGKPVMNSSPVPLKTHRVGQRCTLNLSRAETSSRWCGS
ncbi:uncharacterized protein TNCV_3506191 [Trichonephila clavipes]|uniref:Uncharacterized protein n=1 Tax=Trichonephila clavipes TaxID=2585209 RepID=A0A8X6VCT1_TRICX|nr:uncharacterized protein TNCV_3506191 [Trichonephila clavipes]